MKEADGIQAKIAALESSGAPTGQVAAAKAELRKCFDKMEKNRRKAQMLVRERMLKDIPAAAEKKEGK